MVRVAFGLAITIILVGCATILTEIQGGQTLTISSEPTDALVVIDGTERGRTPVTLKLSPKKDLVMHVSKEGYQENTQTLATKFNVLFLGNFITGGTTGSTIDYATGAMWEYSPQNYHVSLKPIDKSAALEWERDLFLKTFLFQMKDRLLADLAKGEGETLDALVALMTIPHTDRSRFKRGLRALVETYPFYPDFVSQVMKRPAAEGMTEKRKVVAWVHSPAL